MKLTDLKLGQEGIVLRVPLLRLHELGLIPNTKVKIISKGPFGNPIEIAFCGNHLLIDRKTAMEIEAMPCD